MVAAPSCRRSTETAPLSHTTPTRARSIPRLRLANGVGAPSGPIPYAAGPQSTEGPIEHRHAQLALETATRTRTPPAPRHVLAFESLGDYEGFLRLARILTTKRIDSPLLDNTRPKAFDALERGR